MTSSDRGGALVELAIALPFLIIVAVVFVDLGRAASEAIALESAAHAGAQYGAQGPEKAVDVTGIETTVRQEFAGAYVGSDGATAVVVDVERYCWCNDDSIIDCDNQECPPGMLPANTYVRVRVDKPFTSLLPYPGIPEVIMLSREAQVRAQ